MKTDSGIPASLPPPDLPLWQSLWRRPSTRLGWWSIGLTGAFIVLMIINSLVFMRLPETVWRPALIFYGFAMLACGLAAGITALIALTRQHERSWLVWLPVLAGLFVIFLLLGEFLVPH